MIRSKAIDVLVIVCIIAALLFSAASAYAPDMIPIEASSTVSTKMYEQILFQKDTVITVDILVDESEWQTMLDSAIDEEYIACDVVINGETFYNVGIRPKGNSSLNQVANDDTTDRYSFKIKFDKYTKDQTCYGLEKLVLNNMMSDSTLMKEYLSYELFDFLGVVSSLYNYAKISVNGEYWGVYFALEAMEESFAERNYGSDYGQLYRPESMEMGGNGGRQMMNGGADGMEFPPRRTEEDNGAVIPQETGEDAVDDSAAKDNTAENSSEKSTSSGDSPVDSAPAGDARTAAGSSTVDNTAKDSPAGDGTANDSAAEEAPSIDSQIDNASAEGRPFGGMGGFGTRESGGADLKYTDDEEESYQTIFDSAIFNLTDTQKNNLIEALENLSSGTDLERYVDVEATLKYFAVNTFIVNLDSYVSTMQHNYYLYESDKQLTMLPWDYNLAFGGFQSSSASEAVNFPIDTPVTGISLEDRPILAKLLEVDEYKELYHSYLQKIVTEYVNSGQLELSMEKANQQISNLVKTDPTAFYTYEQYEAGKEMLKEFCFLRAESIKGQLDGTIPSTTDGQKENPDALIAADSIDLSVMGSQGGGRRGEEGEDSPFPNNAGEQQSTENGEMTDMPAMAQMGGFPMGGNGGPFENQEAQSELSSENIILIALCIGALFISLIFVKTFKRRRRHV